MKKAFLLTMVGAIVGISVIPSAAPAAWTKHHVALPPGENIELEVTGTDIRFESSVGGATCGTTLAKVVAEGGTTTGIVTSVELGANVTTNCQGTGAIAQCDMHEVSGDNLPWVFHTASPSKVSVTTGTFTLTMSGFFCPHTLTMTPNTLTWTAPAGEVNTTSTATTSGSFVMDGDLGNGVNVTASGTVHALGPITYGI